jgi:hypothetical protein
MHFINLLEAQEQSKQDQMIKYAHLGSGEVQGQFWNTVANALATTKEAPLVNSRGQVTSSSVKVTGYTPAKLQAEYSGGGVSLAPQRGLISLTSTSEGQNIGLSLSKFSIPVKNAFNFTKKVTEMVQDLSDNSLDIKSIEGENFILPDGSKIDKVYRNDDNMPIANITASDGSRYAIPVTIGLLNQMYDVANAIFFEDYGQDNSLEKPQNIVN